MKHQQYREWALTEMPLPSEQQDQMKEHLTACSECRDWQRTLSQVQLKLNEAAMVSPPAGFATRFQAKLVASKAGRQRRQVWLVLTFSLLGSLGMMGMLAYATLSNMANILAQLLKGSLNLIAQLAVLGDLVVGFLGFLPSPAADLMGVSLLVALAGATIALYASLGGLWAAAVYRFAYPTDRIGGSR